MTILEPITAGLIVSLINRFLMPRFVLCLQPTTDDDSESSESSAINADTAVHVHVHH